jgi:pimeloyl-ACP methyl ester carboxylesterase
MELMNLDGRNLAVEDRGSGEAVVLLHTGFVADGMKPLVVEGTVGSGRRLVRFHRRGYGQSGPATAPVSVAEQAGDVIALMDGLGIETAHLVGHSFGATIALEVALVAQERVRSLVLMEPLLMFALAPKTARYVAETAAAAFPLYETGDRAGAVDAWLSGAFGPGYREILERALPGAFAQAARDADTAFGIEVPSLREWPRGPDDLRTITVRALSVVNEGAAWPGFRETHEALLAWLPDAGGAVLPVGSHLLQIEQAAPVANVVARFLDRQSPTEGRGGRS